MKIFALTICLVVFLTSASLAGTLELQAKNVENRGWSYTSTVGFGEQFSPSLGWTGFVLASNVWGEAYFGPTFSPTSWITVAICAGIQSDPTFGRFALWYSLSYGDFSIFHVVEDGGKRWHKLLISWETYYGKMVYWDQDSLGRGPRLEIKGPRKVSVYGAVLRDGEHTNTAFGLIKGF